MKAKIYISSSSSLDQLSHAYSITVIPDIISIDGELYEDSRQISPESFCNRLMFQKNSQYKIIHHDYEYLKTLYNQSKAQGYTDFIYILSPFELDMEEDIIKLQKEYNEDNIIIYKTTVSSILYGMIAQEADKNLKNQLSIEKTLKLLDEITYEAVSGIRLFQPNEVELVSPFNMERFGEKSMGDAYIWSNRQFVLVGKISKKKQENPFRDFIKRYFERTEGMNLIPILLYSLKNDAYYHYLKDSVKKIYPKLRTIKEIALAPAIELHYKGALGIAYLSK